MYFNVVNIFQYVNTRSCCGFIGVYVVAVIISSLFWVLRKTLEKAFWSLQISCDSFIWQARKWTLAWMVYLSCQYGTQSNVKITATGAQALHITDSQQCFHNRQRTIWPYGKHVNSWYESDIKPQTKHVNSWKLLLLSFLYYGWP